MASLAIGSLAELVSDSLHVGIPVPASRENDILLYPNPLPGSQLQVDGLEEGTVSAELITINGEPVFSFDTQPVNGRLTIRLPGFIPAGIYQLKIIGAGTVYNRKLIKL
jgi:hypothetical protein